MFPNNSHGHNSALAIAHDAWKVTSSPKRLVEGPKVTFCLGPAGFWPPDPHNTHPEIFALLTTEAPRGWKHRKHLCQCHSFPKLALAQKPGIPKWVALVSGLKWTTSPLLLNFEPHPVQERKTLLKGHWPNWPSPRGSGPA